MDVNAIGLKPSGVEASQVATGGMPATERERDETRVEHRAMDKVSRRAWFDFNGDGKIDDTSPMYGGDGTLVGYKAPTPDRVRDVSDHARSAPATGLDHARDTYERYSRTDNRNDKHPAAST